MKDFFNQSNSIVENRDCLEGLRKFTDNYFDWTIADVPYGINVGKMSYLKEITTTVKQKNGTRLNGNRNKSAYVQKAWDLSTPSQEYFNEVCRVSKNQIIFGVEYVDWKGLGDCRIKWNKGVPEGVSFKGYEKAYCSSIDYEMDINLLWAGMMQAKSLKSPMEQQGNKRLNEKRIHPTHKPRLLYRKLMQVFCNAGDKILDTHLGGGSIRIEAKEMGMKFYGFEIDSDYFLVQQDRFKKHFAQLSLF